MPEVLRLSLGPRPQGRIRPELEPLAAALGTLGDPQLAFSSILILGTNGKGSTATMLASVLQRLGLDVGLLTSPHLLRLEEGIRVNGVAIAPDRLAEHMARLEHTPELSALDLSPFECITAAGFLELEAQQVDCAVVETGLGAPWDATVLARPRLAGLTNVGTDHPRWLGATRPEIARAKGTAAGLAGTVVLGPGVDSFVRPHLGLSQALLAEQLVHLDRPAGRTGAALRLEARWRGCSARVAPPLTGDHQIDNLHLALALAVAASDLALAPPLTEAALSSGLARVELPGRLSSHLIDGRAVTLDGAHNLEGARALAAHLRSWPAPPSLLVSCLDDKPIEAMAEVLAPHVAGIAVCTLDDPRAAPLERLQAAFGGSRAIADPRAALAALPDPVVAAGSMRLVAELLAASGADEPGDR